MGTKQQTTSTNAYNPQGLSAYNQMTPAMGNLNTQFMNSPFSNPQFQLQQQMGTQQAQQLGGTQMSNILRNMTASGMQGGAQNPAGLEMLQNQSRANTGLQAQLGFMQPTANALQNQQTALGRAASYQPLQTGNQQTQQTSGLGTWLPQVAGLGLGAAGMALGGGGGLGSGFFSGANSPVGAQGYNAGMMNSPMAGVAAPNIGSYGGSGVNPWFMGSGGGIAGNTSGGGGWTPWM